MTINELVASMMINLVSFPVDLLNLCVIRNVSDFNIVTIFIFSIIFNHLGTVILQKRLFFKGPSI